MAGLWRGEKERAISARQKKADGGTTNIFPSYPDNPGTCKGKEEGGLKCDLVRRRKVRHYEEGRRGKGSRKENLGG